LTAIDGDIVATHDGDSLIAWAEGEVPCHFLPALISKR
jgi:hypothetical protein